MVTRRFRHTRERTGKGGKNDIRSDGHHLQRTTNFLTEKSSMDMFRDIEENGRAGTRQAAGGHGLSVQYARTDTRKYSFAVRTMEKWNK
jgi:hypothetical protein